VLRLVFHVSRNLKEKLDLAAQIMKLACKKDLIIEIQVAIHCLPISLAKNNST